MFFREVGLLLILFAYGSTGAIAAYEVTLGEWVPLTDTKGNNILVGSNQRIESIDASDGITGGFRDDLEDEIEQCTINDEGATICIEGEIGDSFFGVSPDSILNFVSLITGTKIFDLLTIFSINPAWVLMLKAPVGFIVMITLYYLITGR